MLDFNVNCCMTVLSARVTLSSKTSRDEAFWNYWHNIAIQKGSHVAWTSQSTKLLSVVTFGYFVHIIRVL